MSSTRPLAERATAPGRRGWRLLQLGLSPCIFSFVCAAPWLAVEVAPASRASHSRLPAVAAWARSAPTSLPPRRRPPPIAPLIRPALRGEGVWRATGPAVLGGPPVLVTTFRPAPVSPAIVAYLAWIDRTRTQLAFYPGLSSLFLGPPVAPSEVPPGQRWRLLATFNGGFKAASGAGGFAINGHTYVSLRRGFGTVVGYRNGLVDIGSWQGGPAAAPQIAFARQNLPLIVDHSRPNPNLSNGPQWGATLHGATHVWRTGMGIDEHGNLIYAAADQQTVATLAAILIHAGAVRAIELDINPEWATFITYRHAGGLQASKLVSNSQQPATRYLFTDNRDFFAVYRRVPGRPLDVPFS